MKLVLESPLSAPDREGFLRNRCYALWCAHVLILNGHAVYASHLGPAPHVLDDRDPKQRALGMAQTKLITDDSWVHIHGFDLGHSGGMQAARKTFRRRRHFSMSLRRNYIVTDQIRHVTGVLLRRVELPSLVQAWQAFERGEWPPCTPGFELGGKL
jgi:hypothetical protein